MISWVAAGRAMDGSLFSWAMSDIVFGYLFVALVIGFGLIMAVHEWRESKNPPPHLPRSRSSSGIGDVVGGLMGCLGSLVGCVFFLILGLVGLFFVVWLVKRMWEAA